MQKIDHNEAGRYDRTDNFIRWITMLYV